jgi:hypothetical protein
MNDAMEGRRSGTVRSYPYAKKQCKDMVMWMMRDYGYYNITDFGDSVFTGVTSHNTRYAAGVLITSASDKFIGAWFDDTSKVNYNQTNNLVVENNNRVVCTVKGKNENITNVTIWVSYSSIQEEDFHKNLLKNLYVKYGEK